jgi:serine/threonine protein kinase
VNEQTLFAEALERSDPHERAAFLVQACQGDPALRARIERLLAQHEHAGDFLQAPPHAEQPTVDEPASDRPGTVIGPYKLLEQIGEGGMGSVWMAQQTEPVKRLVALKLIKAGMDSKQVIARFEAERQALALMDHANIARVLDGGTSSAGRPYFVMDLVKGVPITRYCDTHHLTPRQRLELFVPVCQAVQHAHQKGIIHRDLKPSNVLVALYDGKPVPKVIDFGVAKAAGQALTDKTLVTGFGNIVGTLEYMSPEQAEINQLDIDTRSDIYSLGVLLYELLTGSPPFTKKGLEKAGMLEMLRLIREQEPSKPSTKLSTAEGLPTLAANRGTEPARLTKLVRGELDWIVMKALEKDRSRRYETANGFAIDVQRYLADEPVQACPPSVGYRLRKFARRNKGPVLAAGLVLLAILAGSTVSIWQAVRATRAAEAERLAKLAEADRAEGERQAKQQAITAKQTAEAREAETAAVLEFVETRIFAAARPEGQEGGLGHDVALAKAIESAVPFVDKSFTDQPVIAARLRLTLGRSFIMLGEHRKAAEQYEAARAICIQHLRSDHPDTLRSNNGLATSYNFLGRYADALKLSEETLPRLKATLGPNHSDTLRSMRNLAWSYGGLGRFADAAKVDDEALPLHQAALGPDHNDTLLLMTNMAVTLTNLGRHAEALKLRQETLARRKATFGPDHPETLFSMASLAISYGNLGRAAEALKLLEETLAIQKVKLPPDHPDTLNTMLSVAIGLGMTGRYEDSLKLFEETLARVQAKLGPDHVDTIWTMNQFAWTLSTASDAKFRDPLRAVELAEKAVKASPKTPDFRGTLGTAQFRARNWKGAITDLEKAVGLRGPDNPNASLEGFFLAMAYWQLGAKDKAREWFDKSVQWMDKTTPVNTELKRFRAEAAELLGINKK